MSHDAPGPGSPEFRPPRDDTAEMRIPSQPPSSEPEPAQQNPHFFKRDPNGEVRVRIRLKPEEAALIEDAAGKTPVMLYIHRVLGHMARIHIQERKLAEARQELADALNYTQTVDGPDREKARARVTAARVNLSDAEAAHLAVSSTTKIDKEH